MTIHRTRQGSVPSSGPEPGRQIAQFGSIFVEYSGAVPTQAEVNAHLNPPPPTNAEIIDANFTADPFKRALIRTLADATIMAALVAGTMTPAQLVAAMKAKV